MFSWKCYVFILTLDGFLALVLAWLFCHEAMPVSHSLSHQQLEPVLQDNISISHDLLYNNQEYIPMDDRETYEWYDFEVSVFIQQQR